MLGIGTDESFVEDTSGELIEVFLFDGLEHARGDFGDVGHVVEREFFLLARFAEFVAELAHRDPVCFARDDGTIIGQEARRCYCQEV